MFLTQTDIINWKLKKDSIKNESDMVSALIYNDITSRQKQKMAEGQRYYLGEHDILKKDFTKAQISETQILQDGIEREYINDFENPNRSNHHNVHAFHRILVDQKVSYLLSKEPSITVRGADKDSKQAEYERILSEFANENFNECFQDFVAGASNKGFEVLHIYYDEHGKFQYCIVPAEECIPIYDSEHGKELVELIRYYDIELIQNGQTQKRKRVEWWTKKEVVFYMQQENGDFLKQGQAPHFWSIYQQEGTEISKKKNDWNRLPFIVLKNNRFMTTDLETIKGLIDGYDLISSEGVNNLLDLVELYWVIEGYGGETASAVAKKLQINKAVHISDSAGSVEAKQINIPTEGRLNYLKMLRKDIFHFGMGIDVDSEHFGSAPSGIALKFRYSLLDLKAGAIEAKLKKAIREFFYFVTQEINRTNKTNFDSNDIVISLNHLTVNNEKELVESIMNSRGLVSDITLLAHHPFVEDINEEIKYFAQKRKSSSYEDIEPIKEDTN